MSQQAPDSGTIMVPFPDGSSTVLTVVGESATPEVILILPAMGVTAGYYEVLADVFAENGHTVVLADHRGSGGSSVRASRRESFGYAEILQMELPAIAEAICDALGVEQFTVVGHSLGGQLGLLLAATSPRVKAVAVVAGGSAWFRKVPGVRSVGRLAGLQLMFLATLACGYLPQWFPFAGQEARGVIRDWGHEAMTGRYRIGRSQFDPEASLGIMSVPVIFIEFPNDPYVPHACVDHLARKLHRASVSRVTVEPHRFRLQNTDHFRWVKRPSPVVDEVIDWLANQPEAGVGDGGVR